MLISKIRIQNVRNLREVSIEPHPKLTVFYGDNGSGKTSLLESIHLLGTGKSFRTHISKKLVSFGESSAFVHALLSSPNPNPGQVSVKEYELAEQEITQFYKKKTSLTANRPDISVGIEKRVNGTSVCKVGGDLQSSISGISTILPIQVFAPDVEEIVDGAAKVRRSFLDWGVFHVEHGFHETWKKANQILKQRNALLRNNFKAPRATHISNSDADFLKQIAQWDLLLAPLGEKINSFRESYLQSFIPVFKKTVSDFDIEDIDSVSIRYHKGWNRDTSFHEALTKNIDYDLKKSHTSYGYHRANVELVVGKTLAKDVLSRGQKKSFTFALKIAQIKHLKEVCGKRCVMLLDDLASEVDTHNLDVFLRMIEKQESQVFVTSLSDKLITDKLDEWDGEFKAFHVKHGKCVKQITG